MSNTEATKDVLNDTLTAQKFANLNLVSNENTELAPNSSVGFAKNDADNSVQQLDENQHKQQFEANDRHETPTQNNLEIDAQVTANFQNVQSNQNGFQQKEIVEQYQQSLDSPPANAQIVANMHMNETTQ